jgi:3-deoxy-D-manno-octulosonic-acid transferase
MLITNIVLGYVAFLGLMNNAMLWITFHRVIIFVINKLSYFTYDLLIISVASSNLISKLLNFLYQYNLILVPRHPQRFKEVEQVLNDLKIPFSLWSKKNKVPESIILIDAIGLLKKLYAQADVAILGGSFIEGVGGHNVMEPIYQHCPVITGPYMDTQLGVLEVMLTHRLGLQCRAQDLLDTISSVLEDKGYKKRLDAFIEEKKDLLNPTLELLSPFLEKNKSARNKCLNVVRTPS